MSVVAALAAAVLVLLVAPGALVRRTSVVPAGDGVAVLLRWRPVLAVLAVLAGWTLLGGPVGILAGAGGGWTTWRVLGRTEAPAAVRRREQLVREVPVAVHLLGAALVAGAAPTSALEAVAEAVPGPVADELLRVRHRLALGVDPVSVWTGLAGPFAPLGRTMARAHRSGSSVSAAVTALGEDLRALARRRVEEAARTVEVRAAAPLGVCFLPAFVLLGIVPMTAGVFGSIDLLG